MSVSAVLELYIFLCIRLLPNRERKNRCELQGQKKKCASHVNCRNQNKVRFVHESHVYN
jgi:hypothetical protein